VAARVRKDMPVAGRGLQCDALEPMHDKIVRATIKNDANTAMHGSSDFLEKRPVPIILAATQKRRKWRNARSRH
jgi:hypothetical protein